MCGLCLFFERYAGFTISANVVNRKPAVGRNLEISKWPELLDDDVKESLRAWLLHVAHFRDIFARIGFQSKADMSGSQNLALWTF